MIPSNISVNSNVNVSYGLSQDERQLVDAAKEAWFALKRTFDQWITIGRGVVCLRERADQLGGRTAFQRLMIENGLGELTTSKAKAIVTRLEKIMKPENISRVQEWHNNLPPHSQVAWASPHQSCVIARCSQCQNLQHRQNQNQACLKKTAH